jgi:DNA-binding MarR family transcriptional regulator
MKSTPQSSSVLSPDMLRASGALLSAQKALGHVISCDAAVSTGLDPTTVDLLVRLDQTPHGLRAVELSDQLLLSPSHVSRIIDHAQAADLVNRDADPNDRRATKITITAQGKEVLLRWAPRFEAIVTQVISEQLTTSEADTLIDLLGRIEHAALAAQPADSEAPSSNSTDPVGEPPSNS